MKMNPVFIAAKKFNHWNTLVYTGPVLEHHFKEKKLELGVTLNTSLLYVLPNERNFIGFENNMDFDKEGFHYTFRPQLKIVLKHNLSVGFVTDIPITKHHDANLDVMTRIIWEP